MERDHSMSIVGGILVGAAAMFFLDPRAGRRRRALALEQVQELLNAAEAGMSRLIAEAEVRPVEPRRLLTADQIMDDRRLEARVHATLSRLTSTPHTVRAEIQRGVVTLMGAAPEGELGYILTGIRGIRGVARVESRLVGVPRTSRRAAPRSGVEPASTSPRASQTGRFAMGAAGVGLAVAGSRSGGLLGLASAAVGGILIARAITDTPSRLIVPPGDQEGVRVEKSIEVARSARDLFAFWSNFRNFPQFMRHIREVRESESGISHWVADGPAGFPVSWDAEITGLKPHQLIAWKSLDGSRIKNEGEVRFEEIDERHTRVCVRMTYSPPGGAVGHAVATLFGADPKHQLDEDLRRLKALMEAERNAPPPLFEQAA